MPISISACMQAPPLVKIRANFRHSCKDKVVVVTGATGTGKSRLSIELATRFGGEVINSDKIQVYKGLDIIANKISDDEPRGVPHHLLGLIDPDEDFTAEDYVHHASLSAECIRERGHIPIIAGGSNSFIEALVKDTSGFGMKHDFCFIWVDVSMPVLHSVLSKRVDKMVERGLVEEARAFFKPDGDYRRGIRRAVGLPEMDHFFRVEADVDGETKAKLLKAAIDEIKDNTCKLACRQVEKILRLEKELGCRLLRLDATEVFLSHGVYATEAWEKAVVQPSVRRLSRFLYEEEGLGMKVTDLVVAGANHESS